MKKPTKAAGPGLVLTRETIASLRPLDARALAQVAGGTRTKTTYGSNSKI